MGVLTAAFTQFSQKFPGAEMYVLFDMTVLHFGEELFWVQKKFPRLQWRLLEDVAAELEILAQAPHSCWSSAAQKILRLVPRWNSALPGCPKHLGVPVRSLYDFFDIDQPCSQYIFVFGGLFQAYEFARRGPRGAWLLYRGGWEQDPVGRSELLPISLAVDCVQARMHMAAPLLSEVRRIEPCDDLVVCWRNGNTEILRGWQRNATPLDKGGEGRLYLVSHPEGRKVFKLYLPAAGDRCGDQRAELLLRHRIPRIAFPVGLLRPLQARGARPVVGVVMEDLRAACLEQVRPELLYTALRSVVLQLLELRMIDVFVVDLSARNIGFDERLGSEGAVLYDADGFQIRNSPALAARPQLHPHAAARTLISPSQQSFAEGAFLLHCLLRSDDDHAPFELGKDGQRRFRYTPHCTRWPAGMRWSLRWQLTDEMNSPTPPARSLGEWVKLLL